MRSSPVDDIPDELPLDRGVTVAGAAQLLGCDPSTIRRMLDNGDLQGWRVRASCEARGGVRVSVASIEAYKQGLAIEAKSAGRPATKSRKARPITTAHRAAVARLRDLGILS